jgi:hypothetical protein
MRTGPAARPRRAPGQPSARARYWNQAASRAPASASEPCCRSTRELWLRRLGQPGASGRRHPGPVVTDADWKRAATSGNRASPWPSRVGDLRTSTYGGGGRDPGISVCRRSMWCALPSTRCATRQLAFLLPVRGYHRDAVSALPVTAHAEFAVRRRGASRWPRSPSASAAPDSRLSGAGSSASLVLVIRDQDAFYRRLGSGAAGLAEGLPRRISRPATATYTS